MAHSGPYSLFFFVLLLLEQQLIEYIKTVKNKAICIHHDTGGGGGGRVQIGVTASAGHGSVQAKELLCVYGGGGRLLLHFC